MSVVTEHDPRDPVLRRLPAAGWRALPALAVSGIVSFAAWGAVSWLLGAGAPWTSLLIAVVTLPSALWVIDRLNDEVFVTDGRPPWRHRLVVVAVFGLLPCAMAGWSMFAAAVASTAQSVILQAVAIASTMVTVVAAAVAVVAVPIGTLRAGVTIPTIATASLLAAIRRPLAPLATLVVGVALAWLGITWFSGLLILVVPSVLTMAVASAWPTVTPFGVELPALAPFTPRRRRTSGGHA